jgi:hypothetical protein
MIKTVFYIISVVVILAAAYFAFDIHAKIAHEKGVWQTTHEKNVNVAASIKSTEKELKTASDERDASKTKNAELISTKENEQAKERSLRSTLDQYETEIEEVQAEIVRFEEVKKKVEGMLEGINVPIDQIPSEIEKLENERRSQQTKLEELTVLEEKLAENVGQNNQESERLNSRLGEIREKVRRNAVEGRVTVVEPLWGFVIVNLGQNNSNLSASSDLLVSRGGRLVGRLSVTSLEPNQTICDLDPAALRRGVRIQPGDRVTVAEVSSN